VTQLTWRLALIAFAGLASALTVRTNTSCPSRNPDGIAAGNELATWAQDQINAFFPYQEGWDAAFDVAFAPDLYATFNGTVCNHDTFKAFYGQVYPLLSAGFAGTFDHGFISTVGVPNAGDRGGFVTLTGWEGGFIGGDYDKPLYATDTAFMVVREEDDCSLKIVEMRESSNLGGL
jgi:hypothetical protein